VLQPQGTAVGSPPYPTHPSDVLSVPPVPQAHCEYPEGSKYGSGGQLEGNRNAGHNRNIQGCVWNWQTAMGYNPVKPLDSNGLTKHDHISWHVQLRAFLNISHPVKDMKCDNPVLAATSDFFSSGSAR